MSNSSININIINNNNSWETATTTATAADAISHTHLQGGGGGYTVGHDGQLIREQLCGLLMQETSYAVHRVPCRAQQVQNDDDDDDEPEEESVPLEEWRRKICQWCFRVIDHFRIDREVVSFCMNLFDRFLVLHTDPHPQLEQQQQRTSPCPCPSCKRSLDSRTYQLAAMSSLFLAIKLHTDSGSDEEFARRKRFKLSTFVELSRGQFDANHICSMERTILKTLQWKVNGPTPMVFVAYYLTLIPERDVIPPVSRPSYDLVIHVIRELSRYLTELAVCLGNCSYHAPSHVATAALLVSVDLLTEQAMPYAVRQVFYRKLAHYCVDGQEHVMRLRAILQQALWPEMLLDDSEADAGHPISMAREYGLLNLDHIYQGQQPSSSPPATPKTQQQESESQKSPVSVARCA